MYSRMTEVKILVDCAAVINKQRTIDGAVQGFLYDKKNQLSDKFTTKLLSAPDLTACMCIYLVASGDQIFLLHVSPAQAQAKSDSDIPSYIHLKDKLKGKIIKTLVYGHIENFDEKVFLAALKKYEIEIEEGCVQLIEPPAADGLYQAEFDFSRNVVEVMLDNADISILSKKKKVQKLALDDYK